CHALFLCASADQTTRVLFQQRMWQSGKISVAALRLGAPGLWMNVVEPILFQARHDPPAPALCAPGSALGLISYARLARFIYNIGHRAVHHGIAPGQVVAIQVMDHIFHTALALGLM